MKKNKIFITGLLIAIFSFSACELQEDPNFLSSTNLFNDVSGAKIALNGVYASLNGFEYYNSEFHHALNWSSGMYNSNRPGSLLDIAALKPTSNDQFIESLWTGIFRTISRTNNVIVQLEEKDLGNPSERDKILGQALFIRSLAYFDLVRIYGKAPLITGVIDGTDPNTPMSSADEIYKVIISDCQRAAQLMADQGQNEPGRPTRFAANMLLAKVYMWLAGNKKSGETDLWQKAFDEAIKVYGKYQLVPKFGNLWLDKTRNNTVESIFEIQANIENTNRLLKYWSASNAHVGRNTWARFKVNLEVYDLHVNTYPDDPRIAYTFKTSFNKYNADGSFTNQVTYPTFKQRANRDKSYPYGAKYFIQDETMLNTDIGWNYTVFRYGELLLMLAEIENELRGPDGAYKYINELMTRARNSGSTPGNTPTDWSGLTQASFRDAITREYIFELQQEGMDFFNVRRRGWDFFKEFVILRHNNHPSYDFTKPDDLIYPDNNRIMVLPIPDLEINTNSKIDASDQNSGY